MSFCPISLVRGPRGAQSVEHLNLDFNSGHDLTVVGLSPTSGSALTVWSLLGIPSLSFSAFPRLVLSLSLSKYLKKISLMPLSHIKI